MTRSMKLCHVFRILPLTVAAACASAGTQAKPSAVAETQLAPGLRSGAHEVVLNGARHYYRVAGPATDAPPAVFLHGGPGQGSEHFDALAGPYMERRLRMVYFDQRGSGQSERPASGDYALSTLVEDIEALRVTLGVPKVALIGHSFGGLLALEYGAKYPDHVSHLIFVDGLWDTRLQCRLRAQRLAELRPDAYARVRADTIAPDGTRRSDCDLEFRALRGAEREAYNTALMFPDTAVATRMDSVNRARGIRNTGELSRALFSAGLLQYRFTAQSRLTMPVLVIGGKFDGAAGPAGLRELASMLPHARFVEFEHSGHFVYLDEPDRFASEVSAFVLSGR
jgi:proline iminopeptidase